MTRARLAACAHGLNLATTTIMRSFIALGLVVVSVFVQGCSKEPAPSAPVPKTPVAATPAAITNEAYVFLQFAGTASLATNQHATKLRAIAALPAVQAQWNQTLDKFAANAPKLVGWQGSGKPDPARLRPLLADFVKFGGGFQWNLIRDDQPSWAVYVKLPAERAEVWKRNLSAWLAPGNPAAIKSLASSNIDGWEMVSETCTWKFVQDKDSITFSAFHWGKQPFKALPKPVDRTLHKPVSDAWFECRANAGGVAKLRHLTQSLVSGWIEGSTGAKADFEKASQGEWPAMELKLSSKDDNVRTHLSLKYDKPLNAMVSAWQIPTKTIQDPLLSFTAMQPASTHFQRMLPWLGPQDFLPLVGLGKEPSQLFAWGQSDVPFQTYLAIPLPDTTNRLNSLGAELEKRWSDTLKARSLGKILRDEKTSQINWQGGLPMVAPFLAPAPEPGFAVAGIFPMSPVPKPVPQELIAQLTGRTNVVYYNWEITQGRLMQWKLLGQFLGMIKPLPVSKPGAPGLPAPPPMPGMFSTGNSAWLDELGKELGNSVTEISVASPTELVLTRKSHSGFTALEWLLISHWMGGAEFPLMGTEAAKQPPAK